MFLPISAAIRRYTEEGLQTCTLPHHSAALTTMLLTIAAFMMLMYLSRFRSMLHELRL